VIRCPTDQGLSDLVRDIFDRNAPCQSRIEPKPDQLGKTLAVPAQKVTVNRFIVA
jgi:hypothetical protein